MMQEILLNDDISSPNEIFLPSGSTVDVNDFNSFIQQQYGAYWGTFKFDDSLNGYSNDVRPFIYVDDNIDLHILCQFMINEWKLKSANIVIPVLSSINNHKSFKNQLIIEKLRDGIKNVVNASEVWFITNGMDTDIPQLIGSAFREENTLRRADDAWAIQTGRTPKERKKLVLIGIVCDDQIEDIIDLKSIIYKSNIEIKISERKSDQLLLNSDHTNFIIIRTKPIGLNSINNLEKKSSTLDSEDKQLEYLIDSAESVTNKFRNRFEEFLHQDTLQKSNNKPSTIDIISPIQLMCQKLNPWNEESFPMVCTLVRGTLETIELLYKKIQQEIPTVILKGSGSAADIISFAYEEINSKNDKEYDNSYFKIELSRRLLDEYPQLKIDNIKRNKIHNYIISIIKKADQGKRKFLTFIDINNTNESLNYFHKFILSALLQSQKILIDGKINAQLKRNIFLTLEWNLPDLALTEIFQRNDDIKYTIQEELFDKAILGNKRELFVDLFLNKHFILHRYLNSTKLIYLFNQAKDREFLTTTSLEGILGLTGDEEEMPKDFVERGLNIIVKRLTGIDHFFSKHEIDCNAMGIYFGDKTDKGVQRQRIRAENKALRHLIIYSILMNRHQLAKILWKRSSEPIPLALVCCMMFKKLAPYCHESYQRLLIEKQAKEFSDCAVGVLDKSFNEDNLRTFEMLDEKHSDWNDMTTVELAYNAENKEFVAHAACQKWVTRQFYGEITPRELSWGLFKCPDYLKIICSSILIFPMWFWINFSPIGQAPPSPSKLSDLQDDKSLNIELETKLDEGKNLNEFVGAINIQERNNIYKRIRNHFRRRTYPKEKSVINLSNSNEKAMSHWEEIKVLWTAPITKFYTNFVAYIIFLSFFTLSVMWPSCGNLFLDCFVWFWMASIAFENTHVAYKKFCSQSSLPLRQAVSEVVIQAIFLILYLSVRIIGLWNFGTCQILLSKSILGVALIYYYYRILFIFLPISPILGPLMIRLTYMIIDDFFTFLQLFLIFMISSGAAITAVLFPHYPLGLDLFSKSFIFRGLMALFSSDMSSLKTQQQSCTINATNHTDRQYACLRLSQNFLFKYDNINAYNHYGILSTKCNQTSWIAWFLLIQYLFAANLFLTSLLTAMFGLTGARLQSQSEQIWMYNRYEIVMEYAKRPRLPPPFVVISYISTLITNISRRCILKLKIYHTNNIIETSSNLNINLTEIHKDHSIVGYLLNCKPCKKITEYHINKSEDIKRNWEDSEANFYWKYKAIEYYDKTQENDKTQEKLSNLSNSITNIEKDLNIRDKSLKQINTRVVTLENLMIDLYILIEKIHSTIQQQDKTFYENETFLHILSRESPYIYTNQSRFPIIQRYIPWKISFDLYDPTLITLPKEHYSFHDNERTFIEPNFLTDDDQSIESTTIHMKNNLTFPLSEYKWNKIIQSQLSNGKKIIIDRTTWIKNPKDKTSIIYQLDTQLSIPLNPMGRTGVRGRGALIRWGPNKFIIIIITRWKKHGGQFLIIDGQRILETMVFKNKLTNEWILPKGNILGIESCYSVACRTFNKLAFQDDHFKYDLFLEENDMIEYFKLFTCSSDDFKSHMIYRGYIDDIRNTDNAWVEAEIWNFHYESTTLFPILPIHDVTSWKDVTFNSQGFLIQTSILHELARFHNAYFE